MSEALPAALAGAALDREGLRERVEQALREFLDRQRHRLVEIDERLLPVLDSVAELVASGKRLRAAFCYWGWRGAGGANCEAAVTAAAALELLHASALIHDDVMDASELRRGRPSVHAAFAAHHRAAGWLGDPASFGTAAGILSGDMCLVWAGEMLRSCALGSPVLDRGLEIYDAMRAEVMAGQYLDVLESVVGDASVTRALRVARYKTAQYTVARPLELGAALAGAPEQLLAGYRSFGQPLGEAFQLRDDILGVFGDPTETGKPAGEDLREGKRTVLLALAFTRADTDCALALRHHLAQLRRGDEPPEPGVAALRALIIESGALAEVEQMISDRVAAAGAALGRLALAEGAGQVLAELTVAATDRRT